MARLNVPRDSTEVSLWPDRMSRTPSRPQNDPSPSPTASFSSDKENRDNRRAQGERSNGKRPMAPPRVSSTQSAQGNKRRRLEEDGASTTSTLRQEEEDEHKKYFDPDQDPEERRKVRLGFRHLEREFQDRRDEFLNGDSTEIVDFVNRQNGLMRNVKQTADALADSRSLINVTDLVGKKALRYGHGDGALGIDIDQFVSKCITFMKNGRALRNDEEEGSDSNQAATSTQARRNRARADVDSDEEEIDDNGDSLAWDVLGERACFPHNQRPPVPSFLLGPLSVQKRVRTTQTQGRQARERVGEVTKPQEIRATDLERSEVSNLTNQVATIRELLKEVSSASAIRIQEEANDDMDEDEAKEIFKKHHLSMNFEMPLMVFATNPHSFGQTVENLFYISFLVRDGYVALSKDDDGLPTIRYVEGGKKTSHEQHEKGAARHQAIFSMDYETWQKWIKAFDITEALIPHRNDEQPTQMNSRGWYA